MAKRHELKGVARIDALVAGAACLLLIVLVSVLLARPRERSVRTLCAANLAQIGKTMFVYAADYDGALPRAGGPSSIWGPTLNWAAANRWLAYGLAADYSGGRASISASLYLLVKYYQAPTRLFVCRGDKGTTEFKLTSVPVPGMFRLSDAWDFGPPTVAFRSCSFSYHIPYGSHPLTMSGDPNLAVAADRNPWISSPAVAIPPPFVAFKPDLPGLSGVPAMARVGNTPSHQIDGQNVLFLDGRVTFETRAYCGVDQDNIYTVSMSILGKGDPFGVAPLPWPQLSSAHSRDSLLVHDPDMSMSGEVRPRPRAQLPPPTCVLMSEITAADRSVSLHGDLPGKDYPAGGFAGTIAVGW
jgi:hypothetical protein